MLGLASFARAQDGAPGAPAPTVAAAALPPAGGDGVRIAILGDASVWTTQSAASTPTAFGGGIMWATNSVNASVYIRKGSLDDLDTAAASHDVGTFLLTPGSGKLSMALNLVYTPKRKPFGINLWHPWGTNEGKLGLYLAAQTGSANFIVPGDVKMSMTAVDFEASVGPVYRIGPETCDSRRFTCWGVDLFAGLLYNQLMGDVGQNEAFRMLALGTSAHIWGGFEAGAGISINDVNISMILKFIPEFLGNSSIDGFTGGQLVPAINVSVPIDIAIPAAGKDTSAPLTAARS